MSEKKDEFSVDATADNSVLEESGITMVEVLEQENELEEAYAVVLGASDEKMCTYSQGAIKRQALYSCITCCPEVRNDLTKAAGICLACSYRCHENHELIELYTKRNFRCDCPTMRMGDKTCALNAELSQQQQPNKDNLYNQNFQGLYCKCKRPYPDPERTTEELMVQCTICEDWYHLPHINATDADGKMSSSEMICDDCMEKHDFLRDYIGFALKPVVDLNDSAASVSVADDDAIGNDDNKLKSELDKSIADIMNINPEDTKGSEESNSKENDTKQSEDGDNAAEEPPQKRLKIDDESQKSKNETIEGKPSGSVCRRPSVKRNNEKCATFWGESWRNELCKCVVCLELYKREQVEFLLDAEDSPTIYEERGKKRAAENSTYEQGIRALASTLSHTQQIDAITEYNRMKDKLKEFLKTFAANKKIVTEADINVFFESIRNENNSHIGRPYLR